MRGNVVCFIAPATFLTSLGLIEAAMTRTKAVLSSGDRSRPASANSKNRGIAEGLEPYRTHDLLLQIIICLGYGGSAIRFVTLSLAQIDYRLQELLEPHHRIDGEIPRDLFSGEAQIRERHE